MKIHGLCSECRRIKRVRVTGSGFATLAAGGVAQGVCDTCQEKAPPMTMGTPADVVVISTGLGDHAIDAHNAAAAHRLGYDLPLGHSYHPPRDDGVQGCVYRDCGRPSADHDRFGRRFHWAQA